VSDYEVLANDNTRGTERMLKLLHDVDLYNGNGVSDELATDKEQANPDDEKHSQPADDASDAKKANETNVNDGSVDVSPSASSTSDNKDTPIAADTSDSKDKTIAEVNCKTEASAPEHLRDVSFAYISDMSVFPAFDLSASEDTVPGPARRLKHGYELSKLASEALVRAAGQRGLRTAILRLGHLAADGVLGLWKQSDFWFVLLRACVLIGAVPNLQDTRGLAWNLELSAVDAVAGGVIELAQRMLLPTEPNVYTHYHHLVNPNKVPFGEFMDLFVAGHQRLTRDQALKPLAFSVWRATLKAALNDSKSNRSEADTMLLAQCDLQLGKPFTAEDFHLDVGELSNSCRSTLQEIRGGAGFSAARFFSYPHVNERLMNIWLPNLLAPGPPAVPPPLLHKQVAIVTGASSGIGAELARALAAAGACVVLAARRSEELDAVCAEITEVYGEVAVSIVTDVTQSAQMKAAVALAEERFGPVDIMIANAGVGSYSNMLSVEEEQWNRMVDVNCKGVLNSVAAVLPSMAERKTGHIMAISSDAGRKVFPGLCVYSASKHFVEAMLRGLREEVAALGIRVTSIQPGDVKTDFGLSSTDTKAVEAHSSYLKDADTVVLDTAHIAKMVLYALEQPAQVAVNEVLIEPTQFPI
jgi:NADP-dependent 3-hydroxy acid dehydrogenase YdfG